MNIKQYFYDHLFSCTITILITISVVLSFSRFLIKNDYLVSYEGVCDQFTKSCFQMCEESGCVYYTKVQKYAPDVLAQCGKDITDCEPANSCLPGDRECSITYCDPEIEGNNACETILEDKTNIEEQKSTENDSLEVNDIEI